MLAHTHTGNYFYVLTFQNIQLQQMSHVAEKLLNLCIYKKLLLCFQNVQLVTTNLEMPEPELLGYKPTATEGKSYIISWST